METRFYDDGLYLAHHGILGQKWGVRRFQNYDGTRIDSAGGAKRQKLNKEERDAAKLQTYKEKESIKLLDRTTRAMEKDKKAINKLNDKIEKREAKGKDTTDLKRKALVRDAFSSMQLAESMIESKYIQTMTLKEMQKEKRMAAAAIPFDALASGASYFTAVTLGLPIYMISISTPEQWRLSQRQANINARQRRIDKLQTNK